MPQGMSSTQGVKHIQYIHGIRMATCGLALALLTACAPKSYTVRHPAPSDIVFGNPPASAPLTLVDARPDGERIFSSGILPAERMRLETEVVKVTEATLVYVATGSDRKPRPLPPVLDSQA